MSVRPRLRRRAWPLLLLLVGAAVVAERGRWFAGLLASAAPDRVWIWVAAWPREVTPRAFFLVRDFELAEVPHEARLEVLVDPEYVARLNNRRVGSGAYRPGDPVAIYEVGRWLRRGRNRLQVEARSPIGSGGATARLVAGGRELVATGEEWRVHEAGWRSLADLDAPLPASAPVVVLGRSPLARWGLPPSAARAAYLEVVAADALRPAASWRPRGESEPWREMGDRGRRRLGVGDVAEIDFGEAVAGYLHLDIEPQEPAVGMMFFSDQPGAALDREPDRVVVAAPHVGFWQDVEPRRFRYVTLVGLATLRGVSVIPLREERAADLVPPAPATGLLGLEVEPARSPIVEDLRRRLLRSVPEPG